MHTIHFSAYLCPDIPNSSIHLYDSFLVSLFPLLPPLLTDTLIQFSFADHPHAVHLNHISTPLVSQVILIALTISPFSDTYKLNYQLSSYHHPQTFHLQYVHFLICIQIPRLPFIHHCGGYCSTFRYSSLYPNRH